MLFPTLLPSRAYYVYFTAYRTALRCLQGVCAPYKVCKMRVPSGRIQLEAKDLPQNALRIGVDTTKTTIRNLLRLDPLLAAQL